MNMTMQDLENAINGKVTFRRGKDGPVIPLKLTPTEKQTFRQFIEQGYAIRESRPNTFAAYSHWCSINKRPQIYSTNKAKYAQVELDMILIDKRLSDEAVELVAEIFRKYCAFRDPKTPALDVHAGGTYSYCNRIPKDKAAIVSRELSTIANNELHWQP